MEEPLGFPLNRGPLEAFVRNVLGCQCPDEVFRQIDQKQHVALPGGHRVDLRLDIGHRLLIYVFRNPSIPDMAELLESALVSGLRERATGGFNRLRVVLATPNPGQTERVAHPCFEHLKGMDDRVHLHVVCDRDLPT